MFELRLRRCSKTFRYRRRIASSMGLAAAAGISARLGPAETSVAPDIIYELITSGPARSAIV